MEINCPKCNEPCGGEAPHKPWFYAFECDKCGLEFAWDYYRDEVYDMEGNIL